MTSASDATAAPAHVELDRRSRSTIRSLQASVRDIDRDIEDMREKVRMAERMQLQAADRGDGWAKKTAMVVLAGRAIKQGRKEIAEMVNDRKQIEQDIEQEQREMEERKEERERQQREQEPKRKRSRAGRSRDANMDRDDDMDRDL